MVLLEAMAARRPVIATSVGAVPKVINGENGVLVEPGDVSGLQNALGYLLADEKKRDCYAARGYETVRMDYSSDRMCSRYLELYRKVTA